MKLCVKRPRLSADSRGICSGATSSREPPPRGRSVGQRHVLYLGEINDSQRAACQKAIAVFDERDGQTRQCALFLHDRTPPITTTPAVRVQLDRLPLAPPAPGGTCWLGDQLGRELQLDTFFATRLGQSREGTDWEKVLCLLTLYRLLSPGSEWRLHRHLFATIACADLLGADERFPRTTRSIAASTACSNTRTNSFSTSAPLEQSLRCAV